MTMRRSSFRPAAALLLCLSGCVAAVALAQPALPADVQAFVERREACAHFRGEPWEPGDGAEARQRRAYLQREVGRLCPGTDRRLAALKKKYRANAQVLCTLDPCDTSTEPKP